MKKNYTAPGVRLASGILKTRPSESQLHRQLDEPRQIALIHCAGDAAEVAIRNDGIGTAEELRRIETVNEIHAEVQIDALGQTVSLDHRYIHIVNAGNPHTRQPRRPHL